MTRYQSRTVLAALSFFALSACAPGAYTPPQDGTTPGGRYRVLIPSFETATGVSAGAGEQVAAGLREGVVNMATHTAIPAAEQRAAMSYFQVSELTEVTARQLADEMQAQVLVWGTVSSGGAGLEANATVIDVGSGTEVELEPVSAADAGSLGQQVFGAFDRVIQSVRLAAFCNDFLASSQYQRALENCEEALAISPENTAAMYGKATVLVNLDQHQEALELYRDILEITPDNENALLGAGLAASHLERSDEASGYYRRYLELNPGNVQVRLRIAGDVAETGDYISAYRVLEPAISGNQDDVEFQEYLGQIASAAGQQATDQGDDAAARQYFAVSLQAFEIVFAEKGDDLDPSVIRRVVAVYSETGREGEAIEFARTATQRHPDEPMVWFTYGQALRRADRYNEAIDAYTRVLSIDPDYEGVYLERGITRLDSGDRSGAIQDFRRSGDYRTAAQALLNEASPALNANQWSTAESLLSAAHDFAAGDAALRSQIGFFLGYTSYKRGEAIARANTQGSASQARRAIDLFNQAIGRLQSSGDARAGEIVSAARQFIANQQAIIEAG
ncbi:MAG: tetratricopeptide repeat protein [Longimicrobiaceae bacterium]